MKQKLAKISVAVLPVLILGATAINSAFAQYTPADLGTDADAFGSSTKTYIQVLRDHWFLSALALLGILGIVGFIFYIARSILHKMMGR